MHKHLRACLAPALLSTALCAPAANAVDFELVSAGNTASEGVLLAVNTGLFAPNTRDYSFELDLLGATAATSTLDLSNLLSVAVGGSIEIFNATSAGVATTSTGFSANFPLLNLGTFASFATLDDGFYVARVTRGLLAVSLFTTFTATAAPVPEAETYAMMLAGLGLVGTMVARRRHA